MSYSQDLRERVISFAERGGSKAEAARLFNVSRPTVYKWLKGFTPNKPGPKAPRVDVEALIKHVEQYGDMYLAERAAVFGMTPSGMWRALHRLGQTLKKPGASPK